MEMLKLVYVQMLSHERDKYVWEDLYSQPWDEIVGRMYLLKAHDQFENKQYMAALMAFEQALLLLGQNNSRGNYYVNALVDKAIVQCFLGQYQAALATFHQALSLTPQPDDWFLQNQGSILVLAGAFTDALKVFEEQLKKSPNDKYRRFTLATCLLHLEHYQDAVANYEQALATDQYMSNVGLLAALQRRQPDWDNL